METLKNPNINFPVMSAFGAVIFTVMLLIILSTLSKIYIPPDEIVDPSPPVVIDNIKPPEPLDPIDETTSLAPIAPIKTEAVKNRPQPEERIKPDPFIWKNTNNGVPITAFERITDFEIPHIKDFYSIFQVDKAPFITRLVRPIYPFSAKSNGVEGKVVLRFVVNEEGLVKDPKVVHSEPEGVFEQSALEAIVKYRFRPAMIKNNPVKCIVRLPMEFTLNE
jgi:TonB family protein